MYVYEGALTLSGDSDETLVPAAHAAILGEGDELRATASGEATRFLLLAAKPIGEPVVQYGPFVMNTRAEIEQAITDYQAGDFARPAARLQTPQPTTSSQP